MNSLRPLSPHLTIYKPQLTSTFPIFHRISGAFLATLVFFFYLLCLKIGKIFFTYENFYTFFFLSSKLIKISVYMTALALPYHLYNGARHLLMARRPFPMGGATFLFFLSFFFFYLFLLGIPDSKSQVLVLGASALLYFCFSDIYKKEEKEMSEKQKNEDFLNALLIFVFFLRLLFSSFEVSCFENVFVFTVLYLLRFFLPPKTVGALLLGAGAFLFSSFHLSLLFEVLSLYGYKKLRSSFLFYGISIYICNLIFLLSIRSPIGIMEPILMGKNWDTLSQYVFCPISGMLTLFLVYNFLNNKSGLFVFSKDFWVSFGLFFCNGIFISFMAGGAKDAITFSKYFCFPLGFLICFLIGVFYSNEEALSQIRKIKNLKMFGKLFAWFFSIFLALMGILISSSYKDSWADFYQLSIIFQIGYFTLFHYLKYFFNLLKY